MGISLECAVKVGSCETEQTTFPRVPFNFITQSWWDFFAGGREDVEFVRFQLPHSSHQSLHLPRIYRSCQQSLWSVSVSQSDFSLLFHSITRHSSHFCAVFRLHNLLFHREFSELSVTFSVNDFSRARPTFHSTFVSLPAAAFDWLKYEKIFFLYFFSILIFSLCLERREL